MAPVEALFDDLAGYLKSEDVAQVRNAYRFSEAAHQGQYRKSGQPYISHPLAVTGILAQWRLDPQALMAALLHDVVEDTKVTGVQISETFGKPVADLVDGVSKLDKIEFQTRAEAQAENFRKMVLAMARDVRVILIKLADRLHNMRTLDAMTPAKRRQIATETLEIYAPIANRLGLNVVYQELDDLGFRYLHPNRYRVLAKAVQAARGHRRDVVEKILEAIRQRLADAGIEATVTGREKHLHSIYRKMQEKSLSFSEVQDVYGFRVIVKDIPACYLALGALHGLYKPIPGKFKDYIAIAKANGYQSLHTALFGPFGTPVEVQIRTAEMHKIAEAGVASHWMYKSHAETSFSDLHQKTHQWLQSLLEMHSETKDAAEFLEHLKVDLFPDEVYVFTPKGKIMALPRGATAVDFAYAVHTDVGNRCVAAKINFELVPLRTELRNGDRIEIVTAAHANPNPAWLNFVATGKARSNIRHFLKTMHYRESVRLGERLLAQALAALQPALRQVDDEHWERFLRETNAKSREEVLADIGLGKRHNMVVARKLLFAGEHASKQIGPVEPVLIRGSEGMAVQFAKCCRPIPGDPIVASIKKGQGMVIHTHDCPVLAKLRSDPNHWLDVGWAPDVEKLFQVNIKLVAANQPGVLAKVASAIAEAQSNIDSVGMEPSEGGGYTTLHFTIEVSNRMHLAQVMRRLRSISEVVRLNREKS